MCSKPSKSNDAQDKLPNKTPNAQTSTAVVTDLAGSRRNNSGARTCSEQPGLRRPKPTLAVQAPKSATFTSHWPTPTCLTKMLLKLKSPCTMSRS